MQINVIPHGSPQMFNALVFPEKDVATQHWLRERIEQGRQLLSDVGASFVHHTDMLYRQLYNSNIDQMLRSTVRGVKGLFHANAIVSYHSIDEVQSAQPIMQRYIMAQPALRDLYHRQLCNGYSDSYVDHEPGRVGESHTDYRRVMDGIVKEHDHPDETYRWEVSHYYEDIDNHEPPLTAVQQFSILDSWALVEQALAQRRDPTDIFNGSLS